MQYQPTCTKGLNVHSGICGVHRLYTGNGSAVMSWNTTPLNSNAEYTKYHGIKVWANIEVVQECVTTLRNNKSSRLHKKNTFSILSFLCLKDNLCYFHPLPYCPSFHHDCFHFTVQQHSGQEVLLSNTHPQGQWTLPTDKPKKLLNKSFQHHKIQGWFNCSVSTAAKQWVTLLESRTFLYFLCLC